MDIFEKDLDFIFATTGQDIKVLTGILAGKIIRGLFNFSHKKRSLSGVPLSTKSPIFTTSTSLVEKLRKGDKVEYLSYNFTVSKIISDTQGISEVHFPESLSGGVSHGELN